MECTRNACGMHEDFVCLFVLLFLYIIVSWSVAAENSSIADVIPYLVHAHIHCCGCLLFV